MVWLFRSPIPWGGGGYFTSSNEDYLPSRRMGRGESAPCGLVSLSLNQLLHPSLLSPVLKTKIFDDDLRFGLLILNSPNFHLLDACPALYSDTTYEVEFLKINEKVAENSPF